MDSRGIMTVDLIFATLLILIIMGGVITVINERIDTATETDELGNARMIAENVSEAINKVYAGGTGHALTINLPSNINGRDYTITVNSSGVYVAINGMVGKAYIVPKGISNSNSPGPNQVVMYNNMNYTIKNIKDSNGYNWIAIMPA